MFQKKIVNPIHFYSQIFRVFNTLAVGKLWINFGYIIRHSFFTLLL